MDLQQIINKARELKAEGKLEASLSVYDSIYDALINEAREYSRSIDGAVVDIGKLRAITPKLFDETKKYLKRDKITCIVANNMGTIFAELGDFENAKKMFNDAIEFTPDDFDYKDPHIALSQLD